MKIINCICIFFILAMTGCVNPEIKYEYDKNINFKSYHSFSICLPEQDPENVYDNQENRLLITSSIQEEMNKFYQINDVTPELKVNIKILFKLEKVYYKSCEHGDNYNTWPNCHIENRQFTEGAFIVYVTDTKKNQIIWHASASGVIENGKVSSERIRNTVHLLFQKYPLNMRS